MSSRERKSRRSRKKTASTGVDAIYGAKPIKPKVRVRYTNPPVSHSRRRKSKHPEEHLSSQSNQSSKRPSRAPTPPSDMLIPLRPQSPTLSLTSSSSSSSRSPTPTPPPRVQTPPSQSTSRTPTPSPPPSPPPRTPTPPPQTPTPPPRTPTPPPRIPSPRLPDIVYPKQTIHDIHIGEILTEVKMTPPWFEQEDQQEPLKNIVYPCEVTEQRPFDSVARYRATINKTNNFQKKSIESGVNRAETLMIALDKFAQQFGGDLSFTKQLISHDESVRRTACGIGTLENVHLLATNHILTARFVFRTDLNYKHDLAKSPETMENFTLSFAAGIAEVLRCQNEYIRVLSIEENEEDDGDAKVDFGITTPEQISTKILSDDLWNYARVGFRQHQTLKHVKAGKYQCKWMPLLTYLQLQVQDFDAEHNFDYRERGLKDGYRGGYPYNVPRGWYRQALNISHKYDDNMMWLSHRNTDDVWPIAYLGTHAGIARDIAKEGLFIDKLADDEFRQEAVQKAGSRMDKPGVYLNTHCDGGAHPRSTKTFSVQVSRKKIERFRIVFQCRVKPGEFTVHQSPHVTGDIWRVVDPDAVRPYGILVRKIQGKQSDAEY